MQDANPRSHKIARVWATTRYELTLSLLLANFRWCTGDINDPDCRFDTLE
jgi:hypothetical protein